jgi:hypothetical protein
MQGFVTYASMPYALHCYGFSIYTACIRHDATRLPLDIPFYSSRAEQNTYGAHAGHRTGTGTDSGDLAVLPSCLNPFAAAHFG